MRLTLDEVSEGAQARRAVPAVIDVAAGGRLVGLEMDAGVELATMEAWFQPWLADPEAGQHLDLATDGTVYVELTTGPDDDHARSTSIEVELEQDPAGLVTAISVPRSGEGYEISYPSGNR